MWMSSLSCFTEQLHKSMKQQTLKAGQTFLLLLAVMLIQAALKFMLSYILSMIYAYKSRRSYHAKLPR